MCESAWCARESCHAFAAGRRTAPLSSDPAKLPAMAHFEQEDDLKVTMETPSMQQNPFANCCSNLYHSICFWRGIRAEDLDALQRRQKVCGTQRHSLARRRSAFYTKFCIALAHGKFSYLFREQAAEWSNVFSENEWGGSEAGAMSSAFESEPPALDDFDHDASFGGEEDNMIHSRNGAATSSTNPGSPTLPADPPPQSPQPSLPQPQPPEDSPPAMAKMVSDPEPQAIQQELV